MSFTDSGAGTIVLGSTQTDQIDIAGPGGSFTDSNAGTIILGATESDQLTTTVVGAAPSVSSVTPNSGPVSTSIIIRGANFTAANSVRFTAAGLPATSAIFTVISATQINATVPSFATVVADIVVTTPNGTSAIVPGDQFTITSAPLPGPAPIVLESLVLDPSAVAINRTQFDITPYVGSAGPDWGNAEVNQYLAEAGQYGQTAIDFKVPNRVVTIPLTLQDRGLGLTFEQVRANFQKKVGLFQTRGGWMKRSTVVGNVYAEIVGASLKLGGSTAQATQGVDQDAVLTLITLPDWYGDEITLGTQTCTNATSFTIPTVKGDFPGRVRIVLQTSGTSVSTNMYGLLWGMRSTNVTVPSSVIYGSPSMTFFPPVTAISGSGLGAIGTSVVSIPTSPTTYEGLSIFSQVNTGRYRVYARARAGNVNTTLYAAWFVGAQGSPLSGVSNTPVSFGRTGWQLLDLGEVNAEKIPTPGGPPSGLTVYVLTDRTLSIDTVIIDQVYFIPVDDGFGKLSSTPISAVPVIVGFAGSTPSSNSFKTELRTDGAYCINTPIPRVVGDLPRLPASGMENYPVEIFLRPTTSDLQPTANITGATTDNAPVTYTAQVIYSPCYLVVPES